jgi:hypothetical protein
MRGATLASPGQVQRFCFNAMGMRRPSSFSLDFDDFQYITPTPGELARKTSAKALRKKAPEKTHSKSLASACNGGRISLQHEGSIKTDKVLQSFGAALFHPSHLFLFTTGVFSSSRRAISLSSLASFLGSSSVDACLQSFLQRSVD